MKFKKILLGLPLLIIPTSVLTTGIVSSNNSLNNNLNNKDIDSFSNNRSDDNVLIDFQGWFQNKVTSVRQKSNQISVFSPYEIKKVVIEYLNTIIDRLISNNFIDDASSITEQAVVINEALINYSDKSLVLEEGAIEVNLNKTLLFPETKILLSNQVTANDIVVKPHEQGQDVIWYLNPSELVSLWSKNYTTDAKINRLSNYITNIKRNEIFSNLSPNATIEIQNIEQADPPGKPNSGIRITVTVNNNQILENPSTKGHQTLSFSITGFLPTGGESDLASKSYNWKSSVDIYGKKLLEKIFVDCKKGFTADFLLNDEVIQKEQEQLKKYMNENNDVFFKKTTFDGLKTFNEIQSVKFIPMKDQNEVKVDLVYSGIEKVEPYWYRDNLKDSFHIFLNPTPSADDEIFKGLQQFIQDKVDNQSGINSGTFPNDDNQVKAWVAEYLNTKTSNLPDASIPSSGSFSSSDINLNVDRSKEPIVISSLTTINTTETLHLDDLSIAVKTTRANDINVPGTGITWRASETVYWWKNDKQNKTVTTVVDVIKNKNKDKIFQNLLPTTEINIEDLVLGSDKTSIDVKVLLTNGAYDKGTIVPELRLTFKLKQFFSNNSPTLLKNEVNTIDYNIVGDEHVNQKLFKKIFVDCLKGFSADFLNEANIIKEQTQLLYYMNSRTREFFQKRNDEDIVVSDLTISRDPADKNKADVKFKYTGFTQEDPLIFGKNDGSLKIALRPTPGPNDSIFNDLDQYIQNKVDTQQGPNAGTIPEKPILKEWIASYLNTKRNDLPDASFPNSNQNITANNIADTLNIVSTSNPVTISNIKTVGTNESLILPDIRINVKSTSAQNIVADAEINQYNAGELVYLWENGGKTNEKILNIEKWILKNKNSIFINLVPTAKIELFAIERGSNNTSIKVTTKLDKIFQVGSEVTTTTYLKFEITNFNGRSSPTTIKIEYIDWNQNTAEHRLLFQEIFVNCRKGFSVDFFEPSALEQEKLQLLQYMNSNISTFFNNPNNVRIEVKSLDIVANGDTANVNVVYSGINSNNVYQDNINGTFEILLRPTPGPYDSTFSDLESKLQTDIDNNVFAITNEAALKQFMAKYLNTKKDNLPNKVIPASGDFSQNDISIDLQYFITNETSGNITLKEGAIVLRSNGINITLPAVTIQSKITSVSKPIFDISGEPSLNSFTIAQIIAENPKSKPNPESKSYKALLEYISNNKNNLFNNLDKSSYINSIIDIKDASTTSKEELQVKVLVHNANTINGLQAKEFTLSFSGFISPKDDIILKNNIIIDANSNLFKSIFTDDNGFVEDWVIFSSQEKQKKENELKNYMNQHQDQFFSNKITTKANNLAPVDNVVFVFSGLSQNSQTITANITYTRVQNSAPNTTTGTIEIRLRKADSDLIWRSLERNQAFIDWIEKHPDNKPIVEEDRKQFIKIINDILIANTNNIPKVYIEQIVATGNNINIDWEKVSLSEGVLEFKIKSIEINPTKNTPSGFNFKIQPLINDVTIKIKKVESESSNWYIWVIVGIGSALVVALIVIGIVYFYKRKKNEQY